jgi:hypothetical protein
MISQPAIERPWLSPCTPFVPVRLWLWDWEHKNNNVPVRGAAQVGVRMKLHQLPMENIHQENV